MPIKPLSRLAQVDIADVWLHEATDFTPWLALPENIALLGEALNLELEVEGTERYVGPFKADILCRNLSDHEQGRVVIENQLGPSDHSHLGQLLTYTAGLDAVTNVWIARKIRDEHRAVLDWLNEHTADGIDFFGVELEVWQIGNSEPAPRFSVVCRPNAWSESVAATARHAETGELSESQTLYLDYWSGLTALLEQRKTPLRITKPHPQAWYTFSIGKSNFGLAAAASIQKGWIRVELNIGGPHRKRYYEILKTYSSRIEQEICPGLQWHESSKFCFIRMDRDVGDLEERANWPEQHAWLIEMLERFQRSLAPLIPVIVSAAETLPPATAVLDTP